MKTIAYIRVSTDKQHEGPKAQRDALDAWARSNGVEIHSYFEESVSGGAPVDRREELMTAINYLDAGDTLVVAKRDRLARGVVLTAIIEKLVLDKGASIVSADGAGAGEGPEAQLFRTIIDAFAEYERAVIRARTKNALRAKMLRGEAPGGNPKYGWRKEGKKLVVDDGEQSVIEKIREMRADGLSYAKIADTLNEMKAPSRSGTWHITTVRRISVSCSQ